jgi:hypothetical protein
MPFMGEDAEAEITSDEELPQGPLGSISFANLDETERYRRNLWMSPWHENAAYLPP